MKMLLDTYVFLGLRSAPKRLSPEVLKAYQDPSNRIYLSIVNVLEMQIKHRIGKLKLEETARKVACEISHIRSFLRSENTRPNQENKNIFPVFPVRICEKISSKLLYSQ